MFPSVSAEDDNQIGVTPLLSSFKTVKDILQKPEKCFLCHTEWLLLSTKFATSQH